MTEQELTEKITAAARIVLVAGVAKGVFLMPLFTLLMAVALKLTGWLVGLKAPFGKCFTAAAVALLPIGLYSLIYAVCAFAPDRHLGRAAAHAGAVVAGGVVPQGRAQGGAGAGDGGLLQPVERGPAGPGLLQRGRHPPGPRHRSWTSALCPVRGGLPHRAAGNGRRGHSDLLVIVAASLSATPIRLDEVRQQSRGNTRALQAEVDRRRAVEQVNQARSVLLPQVNLSAQVGGAVSGPQRAYIPVPVQDPVTGAITYTQEEGVTPTFGRGIFDLSIGVVAASLRRRPLGRAGPGGRAAGGVPGVRLRGAAHLGAGGRAPLLPAVPRPADPAGAGHAGGGRRVPGGARPGPLRGRQAPQGGLHQRPGEPGQRPDLRHPPALAASTGPRRISPPGSSTPAPRSWRRWIRARSPRSLRRCPAPRRRCGPPGRTGRSSRPTRRRSAPPRRPCPRPQAGYLPAGIRQPQLRPQRAHAGSVLHRPHQAEHPQRRHQPELEPLLRFRYPLAGAGLQAGPGPQPAPARSGGAGSGGRGAQGAVGAALADRGGGGGARQPGVGPPGLRCWPRSASTPAPGRRWRSATRS